MLVRVACLAGLVLVAGCEREKDRARFDGVTFRTKTAMDKEDRAKFTTTVYEVSQSPEGAIEAGRYEGTKLCIRNFGSSRIAWAVGPDMPAEDLTIVDNTLTFQGECLG